jgi:hypothetical protein
MGQRKFAVTKGRRKVEARRAERDATAAKLTEEEAKRRQLDV